MQWSRRGGASAGIVVALAACVSSSSSPNGQSFDGGGGQPFDAAQGTDSQVAPDAAPAADTGGPAQDAAQDAAQDVAADTGPALVDDIATAFSVASNPPPTGNFQYGTSPTLGGKLTLYTYVISTTSSSAPMPLWQTTATPNSPPYVGKNTTNQAVTLGATATLPPGKVWMHPGANGEYSVIRWVCPRTGSYAANVTFVARDTTTTNVAVLKNGGATPLFAGDVTTTTSPVYTSTVALSAGDTLDFAVGFGTGGFTNDSTGIDGSITAM